MTNEEITATLATVAINLNLLTDRMNSFQGWSEEQMGKFQEELLAQQRVANSCLQAIEKLANQQASSAKLLARLSEKQLDTDEAHKETNNRLKFAEQILEKLSEKQFNLDLKYEHIDSMLTRTSNLLMQAAISNAEGHKRLDRIEANMETHEANLKIVEDKINHLSDTVDRYIAFRMNGHNGNH